MDERWTKRLRAAACLLGLALLANCSDRASAQVSPGQVLVLNMTPLTVDGFVVNNGTSTAIDAAEPGSTSYPSIELESAAEPEEGAFGRGTNEVVLMTALGTQSFALQLPSPATYGLNRGFTLVLTENVAFLLNDFGSVVDQATVSNAG